MIYNVTIYDCIFAIILVVIFHILKYSIESNEKRIEQIEKRIGD